MGARPICFGRRRVFLVGVVVFTAASFVCGLASTAGVLIAARAVQGLGAAIISPAALSIVMTTFEEGEERNKALGIWGAMGGSGAAVGVLAGGVLTKYLGWEWIFFVNVPVGVIAFLLTPRLVRESREEQRISPDVAGAVTVTAGIAFLVYAISKAPDHGWGSGWTLSRLAVSVVLLAAFLVIEARVRNPVMPFSIFSVRTVAGANITGLLLGAVTFANFFILTLYVQQVLRYSALKTGVTFAATAGSAVALGGPCAVPLDQDRAETRDGDRVRGDDRRDGLVRPDPRRTRRSPAISCRDTSSSASPFRSRGSRSRSPRSPACSNTKPGWPRA